MKPSRSMASKKGKIKMKYSHSQIRQRQPFNTISSAVTLVIVSIFSVLTLVACGSSSPTSATPQTPLPLPAPTLPDGYLGTSLNLQGRVVNWTKGNQVLQVRWGLTPFMTTPIDSSGNFSLTVGEPSRGSKLDDGCPQSIFDNVQDDRSVTQVPVKAQLSLEYVNDLQPILLSDDNIYTNSLGSTSVRYIFFDRDTVVTGNVRCQSSKYPIINKITSYDLDIKRGWNIVLRTLFADETRDGVTYSIYRERTASLPNNVNWEHFDFRD